MWGCTFVDTQFPIFIFLPLFSFLGSVRSCASITPIAFPFFVDGEKRGGYAFVHTFGSESGVSLLPLSFPSLLLAQRRDLRMIFLYQLFPHFGAEYFSRGTCCRLSFLPACLLCSAFFPILVRVCFLCARNGLLGLS